jgi:chemotaxis protein MotA
MKPDLGSILGILAGFGLILLGQKLEGGSIESIMQPTAALIVLGGTLGAIMISFPFSTTLGASKALVTVFFSHHEDLAEVVKKFLELSNISRKDGLLALQKVVNETKDPFLAKGLQLLVDATPENSLREMMEQEVSLEEVDHEAYVKFFESAGGFSPTIGIIGAVLGLIHVMENLADPSALGAGIAVAFVATVYGVASANLIFLPAAAKLKYNKDVHERLRLLMIDGIIAIQKGENPTQLKERLKGYLGPKDKARVE